MTLSTLTQRNEYLGTGALATFPYTFKILTSTDLQVYVGGVLKTLSTHYTVTGAGVAGGGNVVFTVGNLPASAAEIVIVRAVPQTQETDLAEGAKFPAETLEGAIDKTVMLTQDLREKLARTPGLPITSTKKNLSLPEPAAGALLKTKTDLTGYENYVAAFPGGNPGDNFDWGTAPPVAGTWAKPRIRFNVAPGIGDPGAWILTEDGTPGTWSPVWNTPGLVGLWVDVRAYGAKGDGVTDDTVAIQTALDTGKNVVFPAGVFLHRGGLAQSISGQVVRGARKVLSGYASQGTELRKISGALTGYRMGGHVCGLENITFNNGGLAGNALWISGHYLSVKEIVVTGQGGTDFALKLTTNNTSYFEGITFGEDNYGDIQAVGENAILYGEFHKVLIGIVTGPLAVDLTYTISTSFYDLMCESPLKIGYGCQNVNFYNFQSETSLTDKHLIEITGASVLNINFYGGRVLNHNNRTVSLFEINAAKGVKFDGFYITDIVSSAAIIFGLNTTRAFTVKNFLMYFTNPFDFIVCDPDGGWNEGTILDDVLLTAGTGEAFARWFTYGYLSVSNTMVSQTFYNHSVGGNITMTNVRGNINTDNISAGTLVTLIGDTSITDAGNLATIIPYASEYITGDSTLSISRRLSDLDSTSGPMEIILQDGRIGELKVIRFAQDQGADVTLVVMKHKTSSPEVFVFTEENQSLTLMWVPDHWITIENNGVTVA